MRQKKRWVRPKIIILVRDPEARVLIGCKGSAGIVGPGALACWTPISCCTGPGCSVYPTTPDCAIGCSSGPCPPGFYDEYNVQEHYCNCVDHFNQTGMDCTVGAHCVCKTMAAS